MIFTSSVPLARGPRKKNYTMFNSFVASTVLLCREVTTIYWLEVVMWSYDDDADVF